MTELIFTGHSLTIDQLGILAENPGYFKDFDLSSAAWTAVRESHQRVQDALATGGVFYGINTGFGILCNTRISDDQLQQLQLNLLMSHAVGVGEPLSDDIVRVMLATKINALALGHSGISPEAVQLLLDFLRRDILPIVPSQGSVGASGDLAPLAHLCLPMIGVGNVRVHGEEFHAQDALEDAGLKPHTLGPKEGLALLNGTQFMLAHGVIAAHRARRLVKTADIAGVMSLETLRGSIRPFHERIQELRPHPGQGNSASNIRLLLENSEIVESHRDCGRVQDPYSIRCMAQVHGASRDALNHVEQILSIELNSVTDNPIVLEDGDIVSGGNFHGQPLALAMDYGAIALAELASISERRTYLMLQGDDGLPMQLAKDSGLNSGFMIPQYTSAALVSENKVLCHPASVDTIPTSNMQEDHVSMGSISATKLLRVLHNSEFVLGIEIMCAAQGIDLRAPLKPSEGIQAAHHRIRAIVPFAEHDRYYAPDIEHCTYMVRNGEILDAVESAIGTLD